MKSRPEERNADREGRFLLLYRVGSGGDEVPCRSSPPITTDPQPIVAYLQLGRVRAVLCIVLICIVLKVQ